MEGRNLVLETQRRMDAAIADVMPDRWLGHGRVKILSSDLSPSQKERALSALQSLSADRPNTPPAKIAQVVVEKMANR